MTKTNRPYQGFARVSVAVPFCNISDAAKNAANILELWRQAHQQGSSLVVFPELALSSYTARDLFFNQHLQESCLASLSFLVKESKDLRPMALLGMPLRVGSLLYNTVVAIQAGYILGIIPKSYLPNYREFEEARWFRPGTDVESGVNIELFGNYLPFGTDLLFVAHDFPDFIVGVEICEDSWVQSPPSALQVSAGALIICNLSASNFILGKAELRRMHIASLSERGKCGYLYVAAGPGESSTDLAFDADGFIYELGKELISSRRFTRENQLITTDLDLEMLTYERMTTTTFGDCACQNRHAFRRILFTAGVCPQNDLRREVLAHPFLPQDPKTLATRCWEVFEIQTQALATRIHATKSARLVLGLSGGLDSTQAALVCIGALDLLARPHTDLHCFLLPGLGTSKNTRTNAEKLAHSLGANCQEIGISEATHLLLTMVHHPAVQGSNSIDTLINHLKEKPELGDVVLENIQARLRTLILMTLANQLHGLLVGTGDLSEKALGWSTYAGDHISMYDVNAGVPKTLIQFVIRWVANERASTWSQNDNTTLREILFSILDTPISPELLPPDANGRIAQLTETVIGPYELHDFFLFHFVRHGARPGRILDLAQVAFASRYDLPTLKQWLTVFLERFFHNQFKRSCTADGPKVGLVALSPRGDFRMPSDAGVESWIAEVKAYE